MLGSKKIYKINEHISSKSCIMELQNKNTGGVNMLTLDYTQSLLNLQEVIVKKVTTNDKSAVIDIEMPKKQHTCPR